MFSDQTHGVCINREVSPPPPAVPAHWGIAACFIICHATAQLRVQPDAGTVSVRGSPRTSWQHRQGSNWIRPVYFGNLPRCTRHLCFHWKMRGLERPFLGYGVVCGIASWICVLSEPVLGLASLCHSLNRPQVPVLFSSSPQLNQIHV